MLGVGRERRSAGDEDADVVEPGERLDGIDDFAVEAAEAAAAGALVVKRGVLRRPGSTRRQR
eukprot:SAG11_NODE_335_length_10564_cov_23.976015_2_plen_62_part_00